MKIEVSREQDGSMIGFIAQEILQHDIKIEFVELDEGQNGSKISFI